MQKPSLPETSNATARLLDRFMSYVDTSSSTAGCWRWTGANHRPNVAVESRYGRFRMGSKVEEAHRAAYLLMVGPIHTGLTLDHLCRNTLCVNPAHLEQVSRQENTRRANTRTACLRGHDFDMTLATGKRSCSICRRMYRSAHAARRRAAKQGATEVSQ